MSFEANIRHLLTPLLAWKNTQVNTHILLPALPALLRWFLSGLTSIVRGNTLSMGDILQQWEQSKLEQSLPSSGAGGSGAQVLGLLWQYVAKIATQAKLVSLEISTCAQELSSLLESIRFVLEMESLTVQSLQEQQGMIYQQIITHVATGLQVFDETSSAEPDISKFGKAMKRWFLKSLQQPNSSISQEFYDQLLSIVGNPNKQSPIKYSEPPKPVKKGGLTFLQSLTNRQSVTHRESAIMARPQNSFNIREMIDLHRHKQIQKTRTIYQSRKSIHVPKNSQVKNYGYKDEVLDWNSQSNSLHSMAESTSSDRSGNVLPWSKLNSEFKSIQSFTSLNSKSQSKEVEACEHWDDFLVAKTPVQSQKPNVKIITQRLYF